MKKMVRVKSPYYLKSNWKIWGKQWKIRIRGRRRLPGFDWKRKREDLIENYLSLATNEHCSFCDKDQVTVGTGATIEHFKPKGKYPTLAYNYNNLFNCCNQCQKKSNRFNNDILNPADINYQFSDYFEIDIDTGEIRPKVNAPRLNIEKARETIRAYNLNNRDRKRLRKITLDNYLEYVGDQFLENAINNFSYRFFIEEFFRVMN